MFRCLELTVQPITDKENHNHLILLVKQFKKHLHCTCHSVYADVAVLKMISLTQKISAIMLVVHINLMVSYLVRRIVIFVFDDLFWECLNVINAQIASHVLFIDEQQQNK